MPEVSEIAPDIYRISIYVPDFDLQFNHFLVADDEPLLFHTGMRTMFDAVYEGVGRVIDPKKLRWIGYGHFESDECGALNQWLAAAPQAQAASAEVSVMVNLNDFADRPAKGMADGEILETGSKRFRLCRTPHLPHGWDASLLYEETTKTLLCSDLFHQNGNPEALTESDVVGKSQEAMRAYQEGILADYAPYTPYTETLFKKLAELKPRTLAIMHGSSFQGDGARALDDLGVAFREVFGQNSAPREP